MSNTLKRAAVTAAAAFVGAGALSGCETMPNSGSFQNGFGNVVRSVTPGAVVHTVPNTSVYTAQNTSVQLRTDENGVQYLPNGAVVPPAVPNACQQWQQASARANSYDNSARQNSAQVAGATQGATNGFGRSVERAVVNPRGNGGAGILGAVINGASQIGGAVVGGAIRNQGAQNQADANAAAASQFRQACIQATAVSAQAQCQAYAGNPGQYSACYSNVLTRSPVYRAR